MGGGVVGDDPKLGLETHTCPKGCLERRHPIRRRHMLPNPSVLGRVPGMVQMAQKGADHRRRPCCPRIEVMTGAGRQQRR